MLNLNENDNQNEPIPSGTKTVVRMRINPPSAQQKSDLSQAITRSASSDAQYLNCEFEVLFPEKFKTRKVFQNYTVDGGKRDDNGKSKAARISGVFLKAAWDAANGLRPDDMSQAAVQKRMVPDYTSFDGIVFPATIAIRAGSGGYGLKNEIYNVITPDKPEYAKLMNGEEVEPAQIGILGEGKKAGTAGAKPAAATSAWAAPAAAPAQAPEQQTAFGGAQAPTPTQAFDKPAWARG